MEIKEHAILYALICRQILSRMGKEEGEKYIEEITSAYGLRRGRRMAENSARKDINDFFINGEWKGREGENISELIFEKDRTVSRVFKCAWYDTWKAYDLLDYGTYYCHYIDKAICKGFDSDFDLNVPKALGYGDEECVFEWSAHGDEQIVKNTKKEHILPFDFHCKELYDCACRILPEGCREEILEEVRIAFKTLCGEDLF
jgi:hypothetical protein